MVEETRYPVEELVTISSLEEFFHDSVDAALATNQLVLEDHTTHYVVNLLTLFSRSEALYERTEAGFRLRPLASMFADAVEARSEAERNYNLQRIGDVALFISGFFTESLAKKAVDIDYYIYMGESAYSSLSEEVRGTFRGNAFAGIYRELAAKFHVLIDVLNEVRDSARAGSDVDLLRTYEIWTKTGSQRAEKLLRQQGVVPITDAKRSRH